ncbi:hypothetical protein JR316_0006762 [Psilocybe cubensis]|uniref:Uncharacterized protein n=1 Tax=Psilocybe cubensis TaxID=181762 RepID=A0ACB8GXG7_PSICU|nr:hypothetical protein JR316_0006762 [Psilocybe cubensis]KAH9480164.1 hypothetical protein JR316_0006762 [Psilocybe cubensis]
MTRRWHIKLDPYETELLHTVDLNQQLARLEPKTPEQAALEKEKHREAQARYREHHRELINLRARKAR